ncbi:MAG: glutamate-5-semialdehyde dehydrogenase [Candidatus Omnitrophica bacterium]|nr:glutamate-5-semialdehyde dehydrogenase [Candidatus Omnitrophota bacterium]
MNIQKDTKCLCQKAKRASFTLRHISSEKKNKVLLGMARMLIKKSDSIIRENKKDLEMAAKKKIGESFIDRLTLNSSRIAGMSACLKEVAGMPDPVGEIISSGKRPNGLRIMKVRVPIGVIGVIYESRPNVTSDCVGLCLKAGNALILRGGSFAFNSNLMIFKILNEVVLKEGLPEGTINIIETIDRKAVLSLLKQDESVDLIIPRGGESLIKEVARNSRIPVIKHFKGLCHVYVDEYADLNMAQKIVINAKMQRTSVCNAVETLLVHERIAVRFLPLLVKELKMQAAEVRGCDKTRKIVKKGIKKACLKDWQTEYLDKILSIKVVSSIDEGVEHIEKYSSGLAEVIVTDSCESAGYFLERVDSACVYLNASSRFTDGNQFGLGAEIGISTDKIHARGPMSVNELTSYKYIILGEGHIRVK